MLLDDEDPSEDLFPVGFTPGPLKDWLEQLGRHPTLWPLKKLQGEGEGAQEGNDPMEELIWKGKIKVCAQVARGLCSPRPQRFDSHASSDVESPYHHLRAQSGPVHPQAIFVFFLYTLDSELYLRSNEAMRTRKNLRFWRPFIYYVMEQMACVAWPEPRWVFRGLPIELTQVSHPGTIGLQD